jgi:hypothetical protein
MDEFGGIPIWGSSFCYFWGNAISPHRPLENYNQSEDYSIERAIDLLNNGLKIQGSRHKSVLLIGMYLKYIGLDSDECKGELHNWMEWQNPNTYTTKIENCHNDIDQIVKDIYEKNYNLKSNTKNMTVEFDEIKWIIENCPEKNQKLITFAMLVHSKRHANPQGVFYMPFKDIAEATGIVERTARYQVEKLIESGVIEVVERNRKPKGQGLQKKLPNLYKINIKLLTTTQNNTGSETFSTKHMNSIELCMRFYFSEKELKKMLPRRQYESILVG